MSGLPTKMRASSSVRNSYQVPCQPTRMGSAPAMAGGLHPLPLACHGLAKQQNGPTTQLPAAPNLGQLGQPHAPDAGDLHARPRACQRALGVNGPASVLYDPGLEAQLTSIEG